MGDSAYRGISADQDGRFRNKEQLLLKKLASKGQFPESFEQRVNMTKVNMEVMRPWIAEKVEEVLGFEDDVVVEYVNGMLEDSNDIQPDPKKMQLSLTGFLESKTPAFMAELWSLLLSAQSSIGGIPQEFVEKKKEEMRLARERDAAAITQSGLQRRSEGRQSGRHDDRYERSRFQDRPPRSRWDDTSRSENPSRNQFVDRRGHRTERVRDSGWKAQRSNESSYPSRNRQRSRTRSRSPPPYEQGREERQSRYFDARDDSRGRHPEGRRYESRSDRLRVLDSRESQSSRTRRSFDSSLSRSPEIQYSRNKRPVEGSITPDYRVQKSHRPSQSLTPPMRRGNRRSPTYSPPGVRWDDEHSNDEQEASRLESNDETAGKKMKHRDPLSRSRWANDD